MPYVLLSLLLVLILALMLLVGATIWLMARMLLCPPRMNDGKAAYLLKRLSPGDLGLHYQSLHFNVRDEQTGRPLRLAAWWIGHPSANGKCVVLIHGYGDAKVGAIAWAPMWHSLGFNILALDLRAHGESEGRYTTAGYFERHDLNQALNELRAAHPDDARMLVLFGISLGGVVALAAAQDRDDIAGVIAECPYVRYRNSVAGYARVMNMPGQALVPLVLRFAEVLSGATFDEIDPPALIEKLRSPVMVIAAANDPLIESSDVTTLDQAAQKRNDPRSIFWKITGAGHVLGLAADPREYQQRIEQFLSHLHVDSAKI